MNYNVEKIFLDLPRMSKVHTKADYEKYTKVFTEERYGELESLVKADNVEEQCELFCNDVFENYKKFGKVRGGDQMNLNYFMIFFIFPTILTKEENGEAICNTLRDIWNKKFDANINYTNYDSLYDGFRTKIFGIPIGKN